MKTSNKLILIGYGFVLLCFTAFFIAAKSNMIEVDRLVGSGNISTRSLGKMTVDRIEIGGQFKCVLNPNSSDIVVEGDDNIIALMGDLIVENRFTTGNIYGDSYRIATTVPPVFNIGIKDLEDLYIDMVGVSRISCSDTIRALDLGISSNSGSSLDLLIDVQRLTVNASRKSSLMLNGRTNLGVLTADNHALIEFKDLVANEWIINMQDGANATIYASEAVSGNLKNNSTLNLYGKPASNQLNNIIPAEINVF